MTLREAAKNVDWRSTNNSPTYEEIRVGCLLRIVDATDGETGVTEVAYVVGRISEEGYFDTIVRHPLMHWQHFIENAVEVTHAGD